MQLEMHFYHNMCFSLSFSINIPSDSNIKKKNTKGQWEELVKMCRVKATVLHVLVGALGAE